MSFKTKIITVSCLAALSFGVSSESSFPAPLVSQSLLLDIHQEDQQIFIVGERGHVLSNQGDSDYVQVIVPTKTTLTAVTQVGSKIWAVGHDATIIHSSDGGKTWEVQLSLPELDRPFLDIVFFNDVEGVAVGAYGLFYRTIDGGESWSKELHASVLAASDIEYLDSIKDDPTFYEEELTFILPHFNRLFIDDSALLMAGEAGMLARSEDRGRSWTRLDIDYEGSFFDVQTLPNGVTLAVGLRGNAFVTKGNESEWLRLESCVTTSLNSIVANGGKTLVVGNNGIVLSLDTQLLQSDKQQTADSEGCAKHIAIEQLNSGINDAIMNGDVNDKVLTAVTASGIKKVELN
ncbi:sialidase [Glaciecola sp. MH2013]|uniref:WD40/YVTN/BNR-like repeat-containing protein n=1 Tax=Glaciecola sp. MH2013 TaxID=2785524 RepID=UPI00189EDA10|nr:YCF48-related protein [Glaciecola sp. MH2013]MBF7072794.1 sialidase [Glaciecola sp. MH2013]